MRKLKVGVIGVGMAFEKLHYPAFQKLSDKYEIMALCDVNREKALKWAENLNLGQDSVYTDWREMIGRDDLDVIDILVPICQNYKIAKGVAERLSGQHKGIICEKPLAPTREQAEEARDLAQRYSIPILIAENYRYNEETNIIRDLVRTGRIGDALYFIQNRVVDFPADMLKDKFPATEWRQHAEFPGGAILDSAVHDIAGLRHIFGPIERLQAFGRPQDNDFAPYSVVTVNMQFAGGVIGQFSFFCAGREMHRPLIGLRIFGTQGEIYLEERDAGTINVAYNDGRSEQIPYEPQKGFYNELLNLYNALTGTEQISVTPEVEYGDAKTIFDILKSIREQRIVAVDKPESPSPGYHAAGPQQEPMHESRVLH